MTRVPLWIVLSSTLPLLAISVRADLSGSAFGASKSESLGYAEETYAVIGKGKLLHGRYELDSFMQRVEVPTEPLTADYISKHMQLGRAMSSVASAAGSVKATLRKGDVQAAAQKVANLNEKLADHTLDATELSDEKEAAKNLQAALDTKLAASASPTSNGASADTSDEALQNLFKAAEALAKKLSDKAAPFKADVKTLKKRVLSEAKGYNDNNAAIVNSDEKTGLAYPADKIRSPYQYEATLPEQQAPKHLGTGSYGDVWKAWDNNEGKWVAIKIMFMKEAGIYYHVTKKLFSLMTTTDQEVSIRSFADCDQVLELTDDNKAQDLGADRICKCLGNHIDIAKVRTEDEPLFVVQEMCGQNLKEIFMNMFNEADESAKRLVNFRKLMSQMLEGVHFIASRNKVHHDIKLDNVCWSHDHGAKFIDFGGIMEFTKASSEDKKGAILTDQYVPPEVFAGCAPEYKPCSFQPPPDAPAYTFDMFSLGVVYWELLCQTTRGSSSDPLEIGTGKCSNWIGEEKDEAAIKVMTSDDWEKRPDPLTMVSVLE